MRYLSGLYLLMFLCVAYFAVGYVCERKDLLVNGCCNVNAPSSRQYICKSCLANGCCDIYEYCVSCCLQPDKVLLHICWGSRWEWWSGSEVKFGHTFSCNWMRRCVQTFDWYCICIDNWDKRLISIIWCRGMNLRNEGFNSALRCSYSHFNLFICFFSNHSSSVSWTEPQRAFRISSLLWRITLSCAWLSVGPPHKYVSRCEDQRTPTCWEGRKTLHVQNRHRIVWNRPIWTQALKNTASLHLCQIKWL